MVAFYNHDHCPMFIISFPKPATPFVMGPVAGPGRAIRAGHVEDLVTTFQDCASAAFHCRFGWHLQCEVFSWIAGEGFGMLPERSEKASLKDKERTWRDRHVGGNPAARICWTPVVFWSDVIVLIHLMRWSCKGLTGRHAQLPTAEAVESLRHPASRHVLCTLTESIGVTSFTLKRSQSG